jgi:hypothetical protein
MDPNKLAQRIRDACLQAAQNAYEDSGIQGLCAEGRWEAAIGAIQTLNLEQLTRTLEDKPPSE